MLLALRFVECQVISIIPGPRSRSSFNFALAEKQAPCQPDPFGKPIHAPRICRADRVDRPVCQRGAALPERRRRQVGRRSIPALPATVKPGGRRNRNTRGEDTVRPARLARRPDGEVDDPEVVEMIRAIVTLLILGFVGMVVLSLLFGLLIPLLAIALKVALVLLIGYFVLRVVSPKDAERVREKLRRVK